MGQAEFSGRRVATMVAALGAVLFIVGLMVDLTRSSQYRPFYVINDASAAALFCVAAVYMHWGRRLGTGGAGRVVGRVAQAYAVLGCVNQALVWVRVAQRGSAWWALVFLVPSLTASILAIVAVHLALRERPAGS